MLNWIKGPFFWCMGAAVVCTITWGVFMSNKLDKANEALGGSKVQVEVATTTAKEVVKDADAKEATNLAIKQQEDQNQLTSYRLKQEANERFEKAFVEPAQPEEPKVPYVDPKPVVAPIKQVHANPVVIDAALDTMWKSYCDAQPDAKECKKP